jgi:hypothetical protein
LPGTIKTEGDEATVHPVIQIIIRRYSEENKMSKKRKILIISVLAAVVILTIGLIGGAAYAKSSTSATTSPANPQMVLADKVASILGLDASTVEAAFTQAEKEIRSEALDSQLQKLVEAGKINQDQATQYKNWLESKPDINIPDLEGGIMGSGGGGRMGPRPGAPPIQPPAETSGSN